MVRSSHALPSRILRISGAGACAGLGQGREEAPQEEDEEAVAAGETTLDLVTWVGSRREEHAPAVVIELSWLPPWGVCLSAAMP